MHPVYHAPFIASIHGITKVRLTFYSVGDGYDKTRLCAPLDFGPKRRAKDQRDRYHFWDYESDNGFHPLSVFPEDVRAIEFLADTFEPGLFVSWPPNWWVKRNWGSYS